MIDSLNMSSVNAVNQKQNVMDALARKSESSFADVLSESVNREEHKPLPKTKPKDSKLMDTCLEMESIFVGKMLKEMRSTVHKGDMLHGGNAEEIFEDMLYDEYSKSISNNSNLGIAKQMYDQLGGKWQA